MLLLPPRLEARQSLGIADVTTRGTDDMNPKKVVHAKFAIKIHSIAAEGKAFSSSLHQSQGSSCLLKHFVTYVSKGAHCRHQRHQCQHSLNHQFQTIQILGAHHLVEVIDRNNELLEEPPVGHTTRVYI